VDTSTLKVDSTNDRVGIGTATPVARLIVRDGANRNLLVASDASHLGSAGMAIGSFTDNAADWAPLSLVAKTSIAFGLNGSTAMTLNANGLGIGVTPSAWWVTYKALEFDTGIVSGSSSMALNRNCYFDGVNWRYKVTTSFGIAQYQLSGNGNHIWNIASSGSAGAAINGGTGAWTQAMTLDASGNLLVGTTSTLAAWATKLVLSTNSGTTKWAVGPYADPNNFIISASGSFGVYLNGTSAVSWTGISDERLKDIIEPISNAVAKVGQLRSVIGKFKSDERNTRRSFLLAQDVQAVLPEAVDASNPDRLGVAYTDVIPLLVAAIKELTARVQTLETR
jgi:hypothetical protein